MGHAFGPERLRRRGNPRQCAGAGPGCQPPRTAGAPSGWCRFASPPHRSADRLCPRQHRKPGPLGKGATRSSRHPRVGAGSQAGHRGWRTAHPTSLRRAANQQPDPSSAPSGSRPAGPLCRRVPLSSVSRARSPARSLAPQAPSETPRRWRQQSIPPAWPPAGRPPSLVAPLSA